MKQKIWGMAWIIAYLLVSYSLFIRYGFWWMFGIVSFLIITQKIWKFYER